MCILLLDTVIASDLHPKRDGSSRRALYADDLHGQTLALSLQSIGELYLWAEQNKWGVRHRDALEKFVGKFVEVPYDRELARSWAKIMAYSRSVGRRLEGGDAWIAATAVRHGLTLVTHDLDLARLRMPGLMLICHA